MDSPKENNENVTLDVTDEILNNVDEDNEIVLPNVDNDEDNIDVGEMSDNDESDNEDQSDNEDSNEDENPDTSAFENEMMMNVSEDEDDDSDYEEDYLQKLDSSLQDDIIANFHPELLQHKNEEIQTLSKIVRNEENTIIDPFHKTVPFLTKYEKARILGERAKQLNAGAKPFVQLEPSVIDGYLIAEKELQEKKIPFIIKRPITNGGCEYWKVEDLEILY